MPTAPLQTVAVSVPQRVNVLTWPQQRNYFTGADAHVKAGSADLTAYNAGNSISDVETRIALTCPLVNGRYQCTYGGVILYNALASITSAKMYIGDVGKSVASGPWCEQIIGFSKVRAPGARIDPGSLADIDTQIKNAFAASPRTHPALSLSVTLITVPVLVYLPHELLRMIGRITQRVPTLWVP